PGHPRCEPPRRYRMRQRELGVLVDEPAGRHQVPSYPFGRQAGQRLQLAAYGLVQVLRRDVLGQFRTAVPGFPFSVPVAALPPILKPRRPTPTVRPRRPLTVVISARTITIAGTLRPTPILKPRRPITVVEPSGPITIAGTLRPTPILKPPRPTPILKPPRPTP